MTTPATVAPLTYTVGEAARLLGISRTHAYELIRLHQLPHLRLGARIVIPRLAIDALLGQVVTIQTGEDGRLMAVITPS